VRPLLYQRYFFFNFRYAARDHFKLGMPIEHNHTSKSTYSAAVQQLNLFEMTEAD
jgi:hypothetical protein